MARRSRPLPSRTSARCERCAARHHTPAPQLHARARLMCRGDHVQCSGRAGGSCVRGSAHRPSTHSCRHVLARARVRSWLGRASTLTCGAAAEAAGLPADRRSSRRRSAEGAKPTYTHTCMRAREQKPTALLPLLVSTYDIVATAHDAGPVGRGRRGGNVSCGARAWRCTRGGAS